MHYGMQLGRSDVSDGEDSRLCTTVRHAVSMRWVVVRSSTNGLVCSGHSDASDAGSGPDEPGTLKSCWCGGRHATHVWPAPCRQNTH